MLWFGTDMADASGTCDPAIGIGRVGLDGLAGEHAANGIAIGLDCASMVGACARCMVRRHLDRLSTDANARDLDAMKRGAWMKWFACTAAAITCCMHTHADGGAVVDRGRYGAYDVTVFLSPVPPSAGVIDFSMLVSHNGEPQFGVPVRVRAEGADGTWHESEMHGADAGNRLMRACSLSLGSSGKWRVTVRIGDDKANSGAFEIFVNPAPPPWRTWLPWMVLWIPVALILIAREVLVTRQRRLRGAWNASDPERFSATILR